MEIKVEELTAVDKEIRIEATREDLAEKFDKAYKKYRSQIQMPGFRPGKTPMGIVKKRFGKEIELDEINSYVQEVYEKQIVPEYEPVGETEMSGFSWEDDRLEVTFKVGVKPEFDLAELEKLTVDKMVHDVTDKEVEEEITRSLERQGNWVEKEGEITAECRVTVDAVSLDKDGNPVEEEKDEDQKLDLRQDSAKDFKENLLGKKAGDSVVMELGEGDEKDRFEMRVKKVELMNSAELSDEFALQQSGGEAKNVDEFKSFIKSQMQDYYDQSSEDLFRQAAIDALTEAHDFSLPEVLVKQVLNSYVEYAKQQSGGELPEGFDAEGYKEKMKDQAVREGKWAFISQKLQDTFEDIEIKPEDIDTYIKGEAAKYGATSEQLKSYYAQNPSMLENMRTAIRENKVFVKLAEVVELNELSKEEFRKKREELDNKE
ncbi:MAG: trigger factor [Balneolaceae bacterium]|nr:MAG: trigger factor [Balneolaceae bacterium]